MRKFITALGLIMGGFMLVDGIHVLLLGKYIGPERPGPWALLFQALGIDVFQLGPLFMAFGILWLAWVFGLWTGRRWAYVLGIALSIMTLWYLPIGTLLSLILLIILLTSKNRSGIGRTSPGQS